MPSRHDQATCLFGAAKWGKFDITGMIMAGNCPNPASQATPSAMLSRNWNFITLPRGVRGNLSMMNRWRGTLKFAIRSRLHAVSSASVSECWSRKITQAAQTSPNRRSGTAITAASAIAGWSRRTFSISAG